MPGIEGMPAFEELDHPLDRLGWWRMNHPTDFADPERHQRFVLGRWTAPDGEEFQIEYDLRDLLQAKLEQEEREEMTHPGQPRDVDLGDWLSGIGFHPANTTRKQLAHEAARQLVADLGYRLWELLPAGRDKSLAFTALEDVLMRSNRALALGKGPKGDLDEATLQRYAASGPLETDPRVETYKAEQRGEAALPERADPYRIDEGVAAVRGMLGETGLTSENVLAEADATPKEGVAEAEAERAENDDSFLRREVPGAYDDGIVLQVSGSTPMDGGGYIDVAVLTTDSALAMSAVEEAVRDGYPFRGFHRTMHTTDEVKQALEAVLDAAKHAALLPPGATLATLH